MQLHWNEWDENCKLEMDRETEWMSITELEWVSYGIGMDRTDEHYRVGMDIWNKYME